MVAFALISDQMLPRCIQLLKPLKLRPREFSITID